jgi:tetratricopeptide (TPR) repeat protein
MSEYKILDYIKFPMESTHSEMMKTCFVVYSTKEEHVPNVIGVIEDIFNEDRSYQVVLLGEQVKSGDSQYGQLIEYLNTSSFAIVILDGFRPNVLFELGILKGLKKPCIVLLEKNATVDVASYYAESKSEKSDNPKIDIDKHFSDVKDRYYVIYDRNNHKELRKTLEEQYHRLKSDIEKSVLRVLFPGLEIIEAELKHCLLSVINYSVNKNTENIDEIDLHVFVERIDHLATIHKLTLSDRYYRHLADIYRKLNKSSKALVYIGKSLIIDPSNISALVTKAFICADLRDENLAISAISDAIKIEPTSEFLWHNKGLLFERFGKIDEVRA